MTMPLFWREGGFMRAVAAKAVQKDGIKKIPWPRRWPGDLSHMVQWQTAPLWQRIQCDRHHLFDELLGLGGVGAPDAARARAGGIVKDEATVSAGRHHAGIAIDDRGQPVDRVAGGRLHVGAKRIGGRA